MLGQIVASGCASGTLSELSYHTVSPRVLEDWNVLECLRYALVVLIPASLPSIGPGSRDLKTALINVSLNLSSGVAYHCTCL